MSKIRETPVSNSEKQFLRKCLLDNCRLDGRAFNEFRKLTIEFGKDWGCCNVTLGKTRILSQVSCEIQQPKSSRPSEGLLNINVELNPMAAPYFEAGRQSDLSVQLNRLLEKCLKDSKAVDLESLCIKMNEKVWALKVDINVLNHEGNILDCASVAALCSLAHFRRPDVTCEGEEFVIHTFKQRDPIPIVIHHHPVCVTYAIFDNLALADPNLIEEGVADAYLTVGLNAYKELCVLHLGGKASLNAEQILNLSGKAANRANIVIDEIKNSLKNDNLNRESNLTGFHHFQQGIEEKFDLGECLDQFVTNTQRKKNKKRKLQKDNYKVESLGQNSAALIPIPNNANIWNLDSDDDVMFVDNTEKVEILDSD